MLLVAQEKWFPWDANFSSAQIYLLHGPEDSFGLDGNLKGGLTSMPSEIEKSLLDIDFGALTRRTFTPSPAAWEVVEESGLDAVLGIENVPGKLERMTCGWGEPTDYFSLFRNWVLDDLALHCWYGDSVVTLVDDHGQVRKGTYKLRFCGNAQVRNLVFNVVAVQLTTMGIPCIYKAAPGLIHGDSRRDAFPFILSPRQLDAKNNDSRFSCKLKSASRVQTVGGEVRANRPAKQ